ncbi:sodium-dependent transporter [bacterium]|nr:sodium-dependent transporter [bacterium]
MDAIKGRERWASRFGLILAMAGNAIGLGNFLRFPVQAAAYGGGAFMIPYFVALLLLGIPLMWVEWAMGRLGGTKGHGTAPGMFEMLWKSRAAKYFGLLGIALPLCVVMYYTCVESWTLAYCCFSADGTLSNLNGTGFRDFFNGLLGGNGYTAAYIFFVLTVIANFAVMWRGISGGIEKMARVAMPMLFIFAATLVIRTLTLGSPVPEHPERNVLNGLAFLWNPQLDRLSESKIWLAAAGQVFFTLSVGFGVISCYASYLRKNDDIALSGLSTVTLNETAEVVLGGSLAIPLAFAFLGAGAVTAIAKEGPFSLAFVTMPMIFKSMPFGQVLSTIWFMLLFFAGITSSVALAQAAVAFMEDEIGWAREKAVAAVWFVIFACGNLIIFGPGVMGEVDFWAGTVGIVIFALIEVILFVWVFGADKAWAEINQGADIRLPKIVYYVLKYITPVYLAVLVVAWIAQDGKSAALMRSVPAPEVPWRWAARLLMVLVIATLAFLIRRSRHLKQDEAGGKI